nr:hypothetical protein CFP56_37956 [Quercus suber]
MESDETIPTDIKCEGKDIELDAQPDEVVGLPPAKKAKTELKVYKRRGSSAIWHYFKVLPTKDEGKPTCKCKKCGKEFTAVGVDITENLKRHLEWACQRKFNVPLSIPVSAGADIATVADDGDDEVHVDGAIAEPTIPPPRPIRAMMETFMTTQAAHGQLLDGLIAEVAALRAEFSQYRSAFPPPPPSDPGCLPLAMHNRQGK